MKVLLKRFTYSNADTIGFRPQTQKLQLHLKKFISVEMVQKVIHRSVLFKVDIKTYFVYTKRIYVLVTTTDEFMSLFEHPR